MRTHTRTHTHTLTHSHEQANKLLRRRAREGERIGTRRGRNTNKCVLLALLCLANPLPRYAHTSLQLVCSMCKYAKFLYGSIAGIALMPLLFAARARAKRADRRRGEGIGLDWMWAPAQTPFHNGPICPLALINSGSLPLSPPITSYGRERKAVSKQTDNNSLLCHR